MLPFLRVVNAAISPLLRRGLGSWVPLGPGVVLLETVGRQSGERREVALLAFRTPTRLFVGTGRGSSDWLANVKDEPEVAVWLGGARRGATAHVRGGAVDIVELDLDGTDQPSTGHTT